MDSKNETLIKKLQAAPTLTTINIPVEVLRNSEYNPRKITEEKFQALVDSIKSDEDFMKVRPLIVNVRKGRTGVVIAGNQRLKAVIQLGWEKVPCVLVDVPEAKEKAWNIKDNVSAGEFDKEHLRELILDLRDDNIDLSSIGFAPEELVELTDISPEIIDPKDDPENKGTTPRPKVKIAAGAIITCPKCAYEWKYGIGVESVDGTNNDGKTE